MGAVSKEGENNDQLGSSAVVGTIPYMAPELFMDSNSASTQSDIYAFGIILCEMLTGVNPFFDEDPSEILDRHLNLTPSLFDYPSEEITPEIDYIFQKCIAKDREERYKDFEELYQDLSVLYEEVIPVLPLDIASLYISSALLLSITFVSIIFFICLVIIIFKT